MVELLVVLDDEVDELVVLLLDEVELEVVLLVVDEDVVDDEEPRVTVLDISTHGSRFVFNPSVNAKSAVALGSP